MSEPEKHQSYTFLFSFSQRPPPLSSRMTLPWRTSLFATLYKTTNCVNMYGYIEDSDTEETRGRGLEELKTSTRIWDSAARAVYPHLIPRSHCWHNRCFVAQFHRKKLEGRRLDYDCKRRYYDARVKEICMICLRVVMPEALRGQLNLTDQIVYRWTSFTVLDMCSRACSVYWDRGRGDGRRADAGDRRAGATRRTGQARGQQAPRRDRHVQRGQQRGTRVHCQSFAAEYWVRILYEYSGWSALHSVKREPCSPSRSRSCVRWCRQSASITQRRTRFSRAFSSLSSPSKLIIISYTTLQLIIVTKY